MGRFSPAPSSRSPRPQAASRYHCHRPFAGRLRLRYKGSQQFGTPRRPSHRIPPRPARPGKICPCRALLLSDSQRERTTCRVVAVQSSSLGTLFLCLFLLILLLFVFIFVRGAPCPFPASPPLTSHSLLCPSASTLPHLSPITSHPLPHPSPNTPPLQYSSTPAPR